MTEERTVDEPSQGNVGSTRERPGPRGTVFIRNIKISNPQRTMDDSSRLTKLDIVRYYDAISEWALPYLNCRPLALVRAPDGIKGEQFFQKHSERARIPGIEELPTSVYPNHAPLLVANTPEAMVGLAQMSVVEIHSWNSVAPDLAHPDRVIFDLDPDPALPWSAMLEAATLVKVVLDEINLRSFAKTSGGKGFHIVVPLTRRQGWEEVKAFSQAVAQHMTRVVPQRFSAMLGPKNRVGKIFIDYLRNGRTTLTGDESIKVRRRDRRKHRGKVQEEVFAMSAVRFAPWVGAEYATGGFRGLRVLLVSESHYGDSRYERPDVTPEIIKALALGLRHQHSQGRFRRHPHYAKMFAATNNRSTSGVFNSDQRTSFWEKVAYCNFIQHFLAAPRDEPPAKAWARGKPAFVEVLQVLQPEVVLCFSSRNGARVRALSDGVPVAVVNHPSARFSYARANPVIAKAFELALERNTAGYDGKFVETPTFLQWWEATSNAEPASCRMPDDIKKVRLSQWAEQMAHIDRLAASS